MLLHCFSGFTNSNIFTLLFLLFFFSPSSFELQCLQAVALWKSEYHMGLFMVVFMVNILDRI